MQNKRLKQINISSFDKSYSSRIIFTQPTKYQEIENFSKSSKNLINLGSNYSYSPIAFHKKSTSLDFSKLNKILYFNKKKKEITVEAGLKIIDLINFLIRYNLWLPQLPGYPFISIGGAVATNVHGKSCGVDGTIKNSIKKILLFHKDLGWINLSKKKNKSLFDMTIGGLGLTGSIVSVTLKLKDFNYSNFLTTRHKVETVNETIQLIKKFKKKKNFFIYSWNDASSLNKLGRGYVFISKPINNSKGEKKYQLNIKKKKYTNFPIWNKYSLKIFNSLFFYYQKYRKEKFVESFEKTIFPFSGNERYFSFYGNKGFMESQLIISFNVINQFFKEFEKFYQIYSPEIILFSLKNIDGNPKFLRFEGKGVCVTFDFTKKKKNLNFLKKIDQLCIKYKIIPSIIKDSRISRNTVEKCFPEFKLFKEILLKFDCNRVYQSQISKKLKI